MTPAAAIAVSGLAAATLKLNVSASNLANANDTSALGSSNGYKPLGVIDTPVGGGGVIATAVTLKPGSLIAYDPTSPLASAQGLVLAPEIDPVTEISNQIAAGHAFAFSLDALQVAEEDQKALLDLKT